MGYGRAGGLRQAPPPLLPRHRRHPHVFLHRLPGLPGEHPREVDPGGQALLPPRTYHTRRKQKGKQMF